MPRESARAAAQPFLFLIVCRAAPSEASVNFTQDRQVRAKNFCGTDGFYSEERRLPVVRLPRAMLPRRKREAPLPGLLLVSV